MFLHKHPYPPFIRENTKKLIVGTLPPPRFSMGQLFDRDVDFCYGSYYNSLWLYIDKIHNLNFRYDNSEEAVTERKQFLIDHNIGICDIVESAEREKIDASDLGMSNVKLRNIIGYLHAYPSIEQLIFTGGNSKNGPEFFFRKHLKTYATQLNVISNEVPRIHEFLLPEIDSKPSSRRIKTISLTSVSGAANISISKLPIYRVQKQRNPEFNTFEFRVLQYREYL